MLNDLCAAATSDRCRLTSADWSADWPVDWLCGRGRAGMRRRLVECARECASMCKIVGPNRSIFSVFHRNEASKWGIGLKFHRKQKWKRKQILNTLVKRMSANWEEFSKQKFNLLSFVFKKSFLIQVAVPMSRFFEQASSAGSVPALYWFCSDSVPTLYPHTHVQGLYYRFWLQADSAAVRKYWQDPIDGGVWWATLAGTRKVLMARSCPIALGMKIII